MNRKILAVLLVCPVLFFATDKMIGIAGKHSPVKNKFVKSENIHINSNLSNEEIVAEMKATIKDRQGREDAFSKTEYTGLWNDDKMKEEEIKFLRTNLVKKLETKNICTIDVEKSFSRCPSGYDAYVILKEGLVTNEGWMIARSGCDDNPIAMFRYDFKSSTVEAKVSDKVGYVPLDEFCKVYKTAKVGMKI